MSLPPSIPDVAMPISACATATTGTLRWPAESDAAAAATAPAGAQSCRRGGMGGAARPGWVRRGRLALRVTADIGEDAAPPRRLRTR